MAKKGKTTLKDLNKFLSEKEKPQETKADFLEQKPTSLTEVKKFSFEELNLDQGIEEDFEKLRADLMALSEKHKLALPRASRKFIRYLLESIESGDEAGWLILQNILLYVDHQEDLKA